MLCGKIKDNQSRNSEGSQRRDPVCIRKRKPKIVVLKRIFELNEHSDHEEESDCELCSTEIKPLADFFSTDT